MIQIFIKNFENKTILYNIDEHISVATKNKLINDNIVRNKNFYILRGCLLKNNSVSFQIYKIMIHCI